MKQPDLGKKIAELRKAKGLTQEELVEKCKLSVRTIQRIESGEVSPRSYTIKLIFAALEYDVYNSSKRFSYRLDKAVYMISNWLEQFYKYVLELFNLKTNTMKKIMILSVPFLTLFAFFLFSSLNTKAQDKEAIREKFLKTTGKFVGWFNAGQMDSIAFIYLDKACMMPDKSPILNSRESIKSYYQQLYTQGIRFIETKSNVLVITDSILIERGAWSINYSSLINAKGSKLTQWRFLKGKWWIENEMTKTDEVLEHVANK